MSVNVSTTLAWRYMYTMKAAALNFVLRSEVNFVDLVYHFAQEVAAVHAVEGALEDFGDDVAVVLSRSDTNGLRSASAPSARSA